FRYRRAGLRRNAGELGMTTSQVVETRGSPGCFAAGPGLRGGDKNALVDQPVLKRQQSKQEIAVRGAVMTWLPSSSVNLAWPQPPGLAQVAIRTGAIIASSVARADSGN